MTLEVFGGCALMWGIFSIIINALVIYIKHKINKTSCWDVAVFTFYWPKSKRFFGRKTPIYKLDKSIGDWRVWRYEQKYNDESMLSFWTMFISMITLPGFSFEIQKYSYTTLWGGYNGFYIPGNVEELDDNFDAETFWEETYAAHLKENEEYELVNRTKEDKIQTINQVFTTHYIE